MINIAMKTKILLLLKVRLKHKLWDFKHLKEFGKNSIRMTVISFLLHLILIEQLINLVILRKFLFKITKMIVFKW
jgi:hypothetical protein